MVRGRKAIMALIALFVVAMAFSPMLADDSDAAPQTITLQEVQITLTDNYQPIDVDTGETTKVNVTINNTSGAVRIVTIGATMDASKTTVKVDQDYVKLNSGQSVVVVFSFSADKFAHAGFYNATFNFSVTAGDTTDSGNISTGVNLGSPNSPEDVYNTILGLIDNPMGPPFDNAYWAALVSFCLWVLLAFIGAFILLHLIMGRIFLRKRKELAEEIRKDIERLLIIALAIFGLAYCLRIAGVDEYYVAKTASVSQIIYVLIGALAGWSIYKAVIRVLLSNPHKAGLNGLEIIDESLMPLFYLLGKIAIGATAVAAILAVLGFNLMAIITGAGIAGIALSLGAQSTLNQFFSGLNLLMTRPFNPGDRVRLGSVDAPVLIVRRVGIMNTVFESWINSEIFTMPNSRVVDSTIINLTSETSVYKILLIFDVAYDSDLDLVKEILLETAMEHPRIIKDGSFEIPKTRVISLDEYSIKVRLTAYVDDFEDYGSISGEIRERVFKRFLDNGVEIPFRQVDVNIRK